MPVECLSSAKELASWTPCSEFERISGKMSNSGQLWSKHNFCWRYSTPHVGSFFPRVTHEGMHHMYRRKRVGRCPPSASERRGRTCVEVALDSRWRAAAPTAGPSCLSGARRARRAAAVWWESETARAGQRRSEREREASAVRSTATAVRA